MRLISQVEAGQAEKLQVDTSRFEVDQWGWEWSVRTVSIIVSNAWLALTRGWIAFQVVSVQA